VIPTRTTPTARTIVAGTPAELEQIARDRGLIG
jgi:hypothetical protein